MISNPVARSVLLLVLGFSANNVYSVAAAHVPIGTQVVNRELSLLTGGNAPLLRDVEANVLVFFRPNDKHSQTALTELAQCQTGLTGKSVSWAGVVSSSAPVDGVLDMLRDSGFASPVFVDPGNEVYGSLELTQHPAVVIVSRDRKLAAFEPFRKINYCSVVVARIRHLLREITDANMEQVLSPPRATLGGNVATARRYRVLAERLFQDKKYETALDNVRNSLEKDPQSALSHTLLGQILAAQGKCGEAIRAFSQALTLDATLPTARDGLERCKPAR